MAENFPRSLTWLVEPKAWLSQYVVRQGCGPRLARTIWMRGWGFYLANHSWYSDMSGRGIP